MTPLWTSRRRFGLLCVLAYAAASWAIRFDMSRGDHIASFVYPLDTFSMYAAESADYVSHMLVRDRDGELHRIYSFTGFTCEEPIEQAADRCMQHTIEYHDDDLVRYIAEHSNSPNQGQPGGAADTYDSELIRRVWQVQPDGPPLQLDDCVITRCRVTP